MHDVARRHRLGAEEPRAGDVPGTYAVTGEPSPSWHEGGEAHPGVQRDPCLLGQNLDRAERIDHGERAIERCPHGGFGPVKMPVKITERPAGVRLIPVGEGAPAPTALPQGAHVASLVLASYAWQMTGLMAPAASNFLPSSLS